MVLLFPFGDRWEEDVERSVHGGRRSQKLRQECLVFAEEVPYERHSFQQTVVDGLERVYAGIQGLLRGRRRIRPLVVLDGQCEPSDDFFLVRHFISLFFYSYLFCILVGYEFNN